MQMAAKSSRLHQARAQMSLDFLVSYGVALIIIATALYIVFTSGIFNPAILPDNCVPAPSFVCDSYGINTTGVLFIKLSQATGGEINVTGLACSTQLNTTNENKPATGNIKVLGYSGFPASYPANGINPSGTPIYSDGYAVIEAYCYGPKGTIDTGSLGSGFTGYIFINYSTIGLPGQHTIIKLASITTKYT